MFVVIVERIVKVATHATAQFAPRSQNVKSLHVCGPFRTEKAAQVAVLRAMQSHTCLGAQVWPEAEIRTRQAKSYANRHDEQKALDEAVKLLDAMK